MLNVFAAAYVSSRLCCSLLDVVIRGSPQSDTYVSRHEISYWVFLLFTPGVEVFFDIALAIKMIQVQYSRSFNSC